MLVLCKILRLFVNTLTADDKYSLLSRGKLTQPIQILLSEKQNTFSQFLLSFLKSPLNFAHFQTKDDPHSRSISRITVSGKGDQINVLKNPPSESSSRNNMVNGHKHCCNVDEGTFIMFIDHSQHNSVGKSLRQFYAKSYDCLFRH